MKGHIQEGRKITCPFKGCEKTFGVKSTFASHSSRIHKNSSAEHVAVFQHLSQEVQSENPSQPVSQPSTSHIEDDEQPETRELYDCVDENLFLKNLSLFYLKLQAKLRLPATVI